MQRHSEENCLCCTTRAALATQENLVELKFQRSACNAALKGNGDALSTMISRCPAAVHDDGLKGYTPLHYAARNNEVAAVKLLLSAGADPNRQTTLGKASSLHRAAYAGNVEIIKLLLDGGANGILQDADGETPLHKAAAQGHAQAVILLLKEFPLALHLTERRGRNVIQVARGAALEVLLTKSQQNSRTS